MKKNENLLIPSDVFDYPMFAKMLFEDPRRLDSVHFFVFPHFRCAVKISLLTCRTDWPIDESGRDTPPLVMRDAASTIVCPSTVSQRRNELFNDQRSSMISSFSNEIRCASVRTSNKCLSLDLFCSVDEHSFHLSRWN